MYLTSSVSDSQPIVGWISTIPIAPYVTEGFDAKILSLKATWNVLWGSRAGLPMAASPGVVPSGHPPPELRGNWPRAGTRDQCWWEGQGCVSSPRPAALRLLATPSPSKAPVAFVPGILGPLPGRRGPACPCSAQQSTPRRPLSAVRPQSLPPLCPFSSSYLLCPLLHHRHLVGLWLRWHSHACLVFLLCDLPSGRQQHCPRAPSPHVPLCPQTPPALGLCMALGMWWRTRCRKINTQRN